MLRAASDSRYSWISSRYPDELQLTRVEMCADCGIEQRRIASTTRSPDNPSRPGDRSPVAPDSAPLRESLRRSFTADFLLCRGTLPSGVVLRAKSVSPPT